MDTKTIVVISIIFCIFGILNNILSIVVCLRKKLRKIPTFIFKAFMSKMNIILLTTMIFYTFISNFFEITLNTINFKYSKMLFILMLCSYQTSLYMKVQK